MNPYELKSYELMRLVFDRTPPKVVAADLQLCESMVRKWAQSRANGSGIVNPLDRMEGLMRCTRDGRLIGWLNQRQDGFFVRNPLPQSLPESFVMAENRTVQSAALLLEVMADGAKEGRMSPEKAAKLRKSWEELKTVVEGFVCGCEAGIFRCWGIVYPLAGMVSWWLLGGRKLRVEG